MLGEHLITLDKSGAFAVVLFSGIYSDRDEPQWYDPQRAFGLVGKPKFDGQNHQGKFSLVHLQWKKANKNTTTNSNNREISEENLQERKGVQIAHRFDEP